jgi:signal-transduction protein with cAMP-binding, CBS, and nucleotidyltransferase domain
VADGRADALRQISLFAELDTAELERVAEATKELEVPAGQVLVQPGMKGTGMFFISEGTVIVETKRDHVELGPGEFFGELALMTTDATRTARVRAQTPLRCLALPGRLPGAGQRPSRDRGVAARGGTEPPRRERRAGRLRPTRRAQ